MQETTTITIRHFGMLIKSSFVLLVVLISLAASTLFAVTLPELLSDIGAGMNTSTAPTSPNAHNGRDVAKVRGVYAEIGTQTADAETAIYGTPLLGGVLISLFVFCTGFSPLARDRSGDVIGSHTLSQVLLGRFCACIIMLLAYGVIVSVVLLIVSHGQALAVNPAVYWAPWLMFCFEIMVGSVAMLLSLFVHRYIAAVLALVCGNGYYGVHNPLYYIMPSYLKYLVLFHNRYAVFVGWQGVLFLSLYASDIVLIMYLLTLWRVRSMAVRVKPGSVR